MSSKLKYVFVVVVKKNFLPCKKFVFFDGIRMASLLLRKAILFWVQNFPTNLPLPTSFDNVGAVLCEMFYLFLLQNQVFSKLEKLNLRRTGALILNTFSLSLDLYRSSVGPLNL